MRLLITGGAGFMGSNFIRHILEKYPDYQVFNLDKLTYAGNLDNLKDVAKRFPRRYQFIKGDICNHNLVDKLVGQVEAIINYAADTHVDKSILDAKDFILTDVIGVYTLLEAAKKHQIKRFIQIGTDEVYGSIEKGSFSENHPLEPNSPYSAAKAGGDLLSRAYYITYGLPVILTRSCNNFGPYQYPEKLIPLFVTNLLENKKVPVYGDGQQVREWIYVLDHCQAIDFILHSGKIGEVYNIGSGCEMPNLKITKLILKELDRDESQIEYVRDRPGHDRRYSLDSEKLRVLGWQPRYTFAIALNETIKWYQNNQDWWQKIKSGEYLKYYQKNYARRA